MLRGIERIERYVCRESCHTSRISFRQVHGKQPARVIIGTRISAATWPLGQAPPGMRRRYIVPDARWHRDSMTGCPKGRGKTEKVEVHRVPDLSSISTTPPGLSSPLARTSHLAIWRSIHGYRAPLVCPAIDRLRHCGRARRPVFRATRRHHWASSGTFIRSSATTPAHGGR